MLALSSTSTLILMCLFVASSFSWLMQCFGMTPSVDSVLHVTKEDYKTCNNVNPIKNYDGDLTKIELDTAGTFYFIGVSKERCNENGRKLILVVLSDDVYSGRQSSPSSNADWVPKLKVPKPSLPQTEDTPPISQEPAPAPVSGAHGLKGGFMGILMGVVGFLGEMVLL